MSDVQAREGLSSQAEVASSKAPTIPNRTEENDRVEHIESQPVDGLSISHEASSSQLQTQSATTSVPRKRKQGKGWNDPGLPADHSSEYESGRVTCETCGESVSFRDEDTGGFTLKHWDAHKLECSNGGEAPPDAASYSTDAVVDPSGNPPNKRRRAKRSEEERIEYLRSDPYVSHFEPYRVLCASCHRWIRLRPNSTYCSIPWDAHRKSCLARKRSHAPENEERTAAFAADPDAKKFDNERVHCRACNKWVPVGADENAIKTWAAHKAACQPGAGASAGPSTCAPAPNVPPPSQHQMALASMPAIPRALPPAAPSPRAPKPAKEKEALPPPPLAADAPAPATPPDFPALAPPQMPHESRRRNAEQRLAMLRADPLLGEVEPNRVYCSLCQKWVQLRQDSSYCAYPWIQHRSKCILRNQKKAQQLDAELRDGAAGALGDDSSDEDADGEEDLSALDDGERERRNEEARVVKEVRREEKRRLLLQAAEHPAPFADGGGYASEYPDAESSRRANGKGKQPAPAFADLDSPAGRLKFVLHSISYLFQTTYEQSDDLTMAALVAYLNTAMPPDKHEDFDTAEVIRAAKTLADRGKIAFEGDTLKLLD